jgi:hypothetical protein
LTGIAGMLISTPFLFSWLTKKNKKDIGNGYEMNYKWKYLRVIKR